jgi:oligoendopeptidase F
MPQTIPQRSEVPVADTWDATSVFASDGAWETAIAELNERLGSLGCFRGRLGEGPGVLADWFDALEDVRAVRDKIYQYASMFYTVDTADQTAAAKYDRAVGIYTRSIGAAAFADPELLAIGRPTLDGWIEQERRLAPYAQYGDQLFRLQEHVRSAEVEELLGQVLDPFITAGNIHSTMTDADLLFLPARSSGGDELEVGQGTISALLRDEDREVRRSAWESYADAHLALRNSMAACLSAGVKQNVFAARARRFGTALEAALDRSFIPQDVFINLIETYRRHLPTWHRYWRVRRQVLGYDRLHEYDIKAPLTRHAPVVPFDRAVEWIGDGMRPLGEEYGAIMRRGLLEQRWVDKYPNRGKAMGAFSSGSKGMLPFILMSYVDDLYSMSTLAHELGHSMHSYLTWQHQPGVYSDYGMFVAETASNFNQALVRAYLLRENSDPSFQIALIEEAMSNFHRYFFIMPTLARFELEIHQRVERGAALTSESLMALMNELFREGYGDEVELDAERNGSVWMQFSSHLYSNFYVYQYATGISAAHALAEGVLEGAPGAVENYLAFLRAGSSVYPLDALKLAGVDMRSPEPVERTFGVLARYIDRLEELTEQR